MTFEDGCSTGLVLSLGNSSQVKADSSLKTEQSRASGVRFDRLFPCTDLEPDLSLCLPNSGSTEEGPIKRQKKIDVNKFCEEKECSLASSCSPHISQPRVKREIREAFSEDLETERLSSRASDEDEESNSRKKLRLSKEQSSLLEDSYREQSTPNPKRKQELAEKLNLRPRQVEVWFQNRRARTKLKQTEVDCEFLKRCCETLTDENRRLQKELQELKALKFSSPLYMQLPAATLTMCPSCERIATKETTTKAHFTMTPKTPFCNPFSHPSAAC
ncbi:Homeobox-leucine zipper protein [Nymphaea thermarum]|nr:Homeobox-leucine zipper protein [Nymphaea thermarum]